MKNNLSTQLDFLENSVPKTTESQAQKSLVIELDHRTWLRFLSEEWFFPSSVEGALLGLGGACESDISPRLMRVGVWFDPAKLPNLEVFAWRDGAWMLTFLDEIRPSDKAILWSGPLPLFAVDHFTVLSNDTRAHLLAMVRNYGDIETPPQPVDVMAVERVEVLAPTHIDMSMLVRQPPENWDSLRGAAAMALYCVPAIGPWLEVLCGSLFGEQLVTSADVVHAPWLRSTLWSADVPASEINPPLWRAMIAEFSRPDILREWRPNLILDAVCSYARTMGGNEERLSQLIDSTVKLLQDRGTIRELGIKDDILELVFQLILLRPTPERFMSWKADWPAIPPGAWWTGAILTGYLSGFRALPLVFRGGPEARKFLALRTWQLADSTSSRAWGERIKDPLKWAIERDSVVIRVGPDTLATHRFSNRGRWYELDLDNSKYRTDAVALAEQFCPELIHQSLVLEEGSHHLGGNGRAELDALQMRLDVKGRVEIALGSSVKLTRCLNIEGFRDWLATSSVKSRLPKPFASIMLEPSAIETTPYVPKTLIDSIELPAATTRTESVVRVEKFISNESPQGLMIVPGFITSKEESSLLASIDSHPWDSTMTRRVQHYGWRYDYKARKVNAEAYIGPLPKWANLLGKRLYDQGLVSELPDQVIVNEYKGNQGIAKHIDCLPCFRGQIVTISLLESWEMAFSRRISSGEEERFKVVLERQSAAVLDGEARSSWYHEIPRRLKEAGFPRVRRVSITFRKVNSAS
ncbi:alpha-ketoglutarate-dependent dioxygenase AlkB [Pseudomonas frederiksbergensis]|uniref:Fe2OG dioxygenase domain-containing protein n=1 Tax=Pseudomonas frederiksbergensis TaxID=104087 RepID=A0AB33E8X4_9PSED|nr:alpha-ketoglutarate-dependent dioxygenase AlkB [Pseudomonas frederiksbergensis]ATE76876.1 hypothetical protein CNN82_10725 [Pseudomonas frederiksbergensis]